MAVRRFDPYTYHDMDDFVKKAFNEALKENRQDFAVLEEKFNECTPTVLHVVVHQMGSEAGKDFINNVASNESRLSFVQNLCFAFFVYGAKMNK